MLGRWLDDSYAPEVRGNITALAGARTTSNACYRFVGPFIATIARGLDVQLADIGVAIAISELFGLASPLIGRVVDLHTVEAAALADALDGHCAGSRPFSQAAVASVRDPVRYHASNERASRTSTGMRAS